MTAALKPALQHSYRLSAFERRKNDFYPTPSDLVASVPLGFSRLGLGLPRVALDPCGGDGALRRGLAPFGVDVMRWNGPLRQHLVLKRGRCSNATKEGPFHEVC